MVLEVIAAFCGALIVTIVSGFVLIPLLRRMKAGQTIREDGPVWHNEKQGTPTIGGLMFIAGVIVACFTAGFGKISEGEFGHLYILLFGIIFGVIGFIDDYSKVKKKRNLGLKALPKFALQLVVAVGFLLLMMYTGNLTTSLYVPFFDATIAIAEPLYLIFAAFVIVGTVNSVNITDGVDGLVTGVTLPVVLCFTGIAFAWDQAAIDVAKDHAAIGIVTTALAGGLFAFLIFNFHPARVFMGDTGSLFLGGIICATAFAMDIPLILLPLGVVYFIETLSDIIQVTYFKISGGKRVFKMAPIHHHFEMCGWNEYAIFFVFTGVSVIFAAISYFGVINRY